MVDSNDKIFKQNNLWLTQYWIQSFLFLNLETTCSIQFVTAVVVHSSQEIQHSFTPPAAICNNREQSFEQLEYWFSRYLQTNCNSNHQQLFITQTFDDKQQNQTFKRGRNSKYIETEILFYIDNWRYLHQYLKWRRRYSCLVLFMFSGCKLQ